MKIQLLVAALAAATLLSACSKGEHVHAVDKVQEAEAAALAKAPKAEEVKFEDEGQAPVATAADAATTEPAAEAKEEPAKAEDKAEEKAETEEKAEAPKAEAEKAADAEAKK